MEFTAQHPQIPELSDYTNITFREDKKTIFEQKHVRDSVQSWQLEFFRLSLDQSAMFEDLLSRIPKLSECQYERRARNTFINVVRALFDFLDQHLKQVETEKKTVAEQYVEFHKSLQRFLFGFKARPQFRYLVVEIDYGGEELLGGAPQFSLEKYDQDPQGMWYAFLAKAYREKQSEVVQLIQDYTLFRTNVEETSDGITKKAFANLSKALVILLEREIPELRVYVPSVPKICAFIVKSELENVGEQKIYLEKILTSRESEPTKGERLRQIVKDVKRDIRGYPVDGSARLETIVGLISEHYLSLYDLDQSVSFWYEVEKKDLLLKLLLSVHRSPRCYAFASAMLFLLLTTLSVFNVQQYDWLTPVNPWLPWIALGIMILVYGGIMSLVLWVGYRLFWKKDLYYSQLFLPRLLGAIVVGLTALLVQDTPWRMGIMLRDPLNLTLVCLVTYFLSFVYVFIEVYNTTKFLRLRQERDENIIPYVLEVSTRIFSIGLVEAFLAVLFTSTLFYPAMNLVATSDIIGGITFLQGRLISFGFFPALIILWTGLALFIGAFVQLLWQEKRITASA